MEKLFDVSKLYAQDPKLIKEEVDMLLVWCSKQGHFPKVTELQAALALHACYYSIEQAKTTLENYFTIRTLCPDLFACKHPDKDVSLKQSLNGSILAVLPKQTKEGYHIVLSRLIDTNPDRYNPQVDSKLLDMNLLRHVHTEGPGTGIVVLIDMKGGVFGHLTKLNIGEFRKFLVYLQTAMPIRLVAVHFINVVSFMDKLMGLVKPFINKDLYNKLIFHSDIKSLYNYIPQECLPEDYDGSIESIQTLHEKFKQSIYDNQWFFEFQNTMIVNESKRIGPRKNADSLFGFDGTFKKLSID